MNVKRVIKQGVVRLLASRGYTLTKMSSEPRRATMEGAMQAISERKHGFNTVLDIGASDGSWSSLLMQHYPACRYLLIEAQPVHEKALERFCSGKRNAQFVLAAAGEKKGAVYFDARGPLGGQASYTPFATDCITVSVTTVDDEIRSRALPGPYLLKLDTHGFEVPILKGSAKALEETEVIVIECYNFRIAPECLLFHEMCDWLKGYGFRCIDLADPLHRPRDNSFWQMDLVFVKEDRPEFTNSKY